MINANRTIAQIALAQPSAAEVLNRLGISYCCEGQKTLRSACSEIGLSAEDVIQALNDAATDDKDFASRNSSKTFESMILQTLRTRHEELRHALPPLNTLAIRAVEHNRTKHPEIVTIEELLQALSLELTAHLAEEERNLFPAVLQLELAYVGESPAPRQPGLVLEIIGSMSQQHDASATTLRRMSTAGNRFRYPEHADTSICEFYDGLQRLFADLQRDLHIENNVLFPQAARMEAEIFHGYRSGSC
jgi:regulator of cell morphogenesis and NO signaling